MTIFRLNIHGYHSFCILRIIGASKIDQTEDFAWKYSFDGEKNLPYWTGRRLYAIISKPNDSEWKIDNHWFWKFQWKLKFIDLSPLPRGPDGKMNNATND